VAAPSFGGHELVCRGLCPRITRSCRLPSCSPQFRVAGLANRSDTLYIGATIGTLTGADGRETGRAPAVKTREIVGDPHLSTRNDPRNRSSMAPSTGKRVSPPATARQPGLGRSPVSFLSRAGTEGAGRIGISGHRTGASALAMRAMRPRVDHLRSHIEMRAYT
jgi:hypothetical protein